MISDEAAWNLWFMCLPAWDQRTVLRFDLEWHDAFLRGELTYAELRVKINSAQGIESPPSPESLRV